MKIQKRGESRTVLVEGDRVTCSISHQLRIDGEDTWTKFETNAQVQAGEDADEAAERVIQYTNDKAMRVVYLAVETVKGQ